MVVRTGARPPTDRRHPGPAPAALEVAWNLDVLHKYGRRRSRARQALRRRRPELSAGGAESWLAEAQAVVGRLAARVLDAPTALAAEFADQRTPRPETLRLARDLHASATRFPLRCLSEQIGRAVLHLLLR